MARGELEKKRTPASRRFRMPVGSFDLPKTTGTKKRQEEEGAPSSCHGRSRGGYQDGKPSSQVRSRV